MATWNVGKKNGMWRGGKSLASNGYVLIRVGVEHHLADIRGYAYEHRLVAEKKLGRRLKKGEIVHHVNGNKSDNRPVNIEVCRTRAHHGVKHRSGRRKLRLPDEKNEQVFCECGCGEAILKFDASRRLRRFISGHNRRVSVRKEN